METRTKVVSILEHFFFKATHQSRKTLFMRALAGVRTSVESKGSLRSEENFNPIHPASSAVGKMR